MGFGDYPFGDGPFGEDPVAALSARTTPTSPTPFFDPYLRDFPFTLNGEELQNVHPVIQSAAIALGVPLGSIPAAPTVGFDVRRVRATRDADVSAVFDDEARLCVAHLTKPGLLEVVETRASAANGSVEGSVVVRNLLDPKSEIVPIPVRF